MMSSSFPKDGDKADIAAVSLVERLAAYLPHLALPEPKVMPPAFEGALVQVEIEGFSALAESLARLGREGAEMLSRVLNAYFGPLLQSLEELGGDVLHFDGQGLLAFFPAAQSAALSSALDRASTASLKFLAVNEAFRGVQTADGRFSLQMRVGSAAGTLQILVVGTSMLGQSLVFNGLALEAARRACLQARWGEALVWEDNRMKTAEAQVVSPGVLTSSLARLFEAEDPLSVFNRLSPYLPRQLAQRLKGSTSSLGPAEEFRRVVNLFVHVPNLDLEQESDVARLQAYYSAVQQVCAGLDGRVHEITPRPLEKAVRLHLTFGALLSNNEDAAHALRAALAVRDLPIPSGGSPALGVASGNVFTGSVGTPGRQKYIVLGDVVSLSAYFAQAATERGDGTLLVDRYTRERVGLSYLFGEDIILNLPAWPFPVRASRLLAPRPAPCNLVTFLREYPPTGPAPTAVLGTLDAVLAGQRHVLLTEPGQASHLAGRWLKRVGRGAAGLCLLHAADVPYLAWSGLLGGLIGLAESDSRTEKAAKISEAVVRFAPDYVPLTGWLSQMLGLAQEEPGFRQRLSGPQRGQFVQMVTQLLQGMALAGPLLLIFRDLQWCDEPGLQLLESAVHALAGSPILFGLTTRPEHGEMAEWVSHLPGLVR